ncbi:MAG: PrsW family intramembrane metalloprotease [Caldilineaceae bacterium]|nr:PrsW family intramembrane metalloprotease [Caldilineaceae bacterium]
MSILAGLYLSLIAAVLPTVLFVAIFYWADRYEREPWWLAAVAFLWGAIPAVLASIVGEVLLGVSLAGDNPGFEAEVIESALFAPVVEELAKGVALWGIYRWFRHEFDGVLDGLLYGALIGFGFAMTENMLYFFGAFSEGGLGGLTVIFLLRVVLFGLNHSFYTGLTGIGFGLARHARRRSTRWLWPLAGLAAAIVAHGLHNLGASIASLNAAGLGISLLLAAGGLVVLVLTVLLSWQHERSAVRAELAGEVGVLLSEDEFKSLTGRWHQPLRRRRAQGNHAARMQSLVQLALRQQRLRRVGEQQEPRLTAEVNQLRSNLLRAYAEALALRP